MNNATTTEERTMIATLNTPDACIAAAAAAEAKGGVGSAEAADLLRFRAARLAAEAAAKKTDDEIAAEVEAMMDASDWPF